MGSRNTTGMISLRSNNNTAADLGFANDPGLEVTEAPRTVANVSHTQQLPGRPSVSALVMVAVVVSMVEGGLQNANDADPVNKLVDNSGVKGKTCMRLLKFWSPDSKT